MADALSKDAGPIDQTVHRKLLIVDDLRDFAESVSEVLEWEGYETFIACSAAEAVSAARHFDASVVLVDIRLGKTSGIDLIAQLKVICPQAYFIVMTAYAAVETAIEAIRRGAYAYLRKPLMNEELLATLERCFQTIRLHKEKEAAECELRIRESEYRRLFDNLPDIFYRTDMQGNLVLVSPSIQAVLGYSPEEAVGKNLFRDFFKDAGQGEGLLGRLLGMTYPDSFQGELTAKDGSTVWIAASVRHYKDLSENILGIEGIARDITSSKQAEEERIRLATAIEQAAELIFITDTQGVIQYVNPSFTRVTGYSEAEAIGQNPRLLKSGVQDKAFYEQMWNTISQGKVWQGRLVNRKKDGAQYHEEATISPIRDQNGRIISYVAVKRDITKEAMLERQLIQSQKMEAIGTLAGGIAHDFNNILASMMGYAELALIDPRDTDGTVRNLKNIIRASHRAKDLVTQILYFSRREEFELKVLDLGKVITDAFTLLRASLPATIEIRQAVETDDRLILADPTQINQVLMNVCTNAGHAMRDKGGLLEVTLDEALADAEFPSLFPDMMPNEYLRLVIRDTGQGIPSDLIERIFEPYFTTKKKGEGTGLGLAIVHGIVQRHKGQITVQSKLGQGTCFRIFLPHTTDREIDADQTPSAESLPRGHESILLVDDEEDIREISKMMLERLGYRVEAFSNGDTALDAFRAQPDNYDALITDMTMPGITGDQLAKAIKQIRPEMPVLMCTGYSEKMTSESARNIGIDTLMMKPVTMKSLANLLSRVFGRGSSQEMASEH